MKAQRARAGMVIAWGLLLAAAGMGCSSSVGSSGSGGAGGAGGGTGASSTTGSGGSGAAGGGGGGATSNGGSGGGDVVECPPPDTAKYEQCTAAKDQASCEAAEGTWAPVGFGVEPRCQCATGQAGCPCTNGTQCLAGCLSKGEETCPGPTEFECAAYSLYSWCGCKRIDDGSAQNTCYDI